MLCHRAMVSDVSNERGVLETLRTPRRASHLCVTGDLTPQNQGCENLSSITLESMEQIWQTRIIFL
jgi:hypothetical protein